MANSARYAQFFFQLADLGSQLSISKLRDCSRALLKLMPAGKFLNFGNILCIGKFVNKLDELLLSIKNIKGYPEV